MHRRGPTAPTQRLVAALLVTVLAGCVTENRPESCDEPATTIDLALTATELDPNDPAACTGQDVTLTVHSGVDGVLHVHGLDAVVPATTVAAGETLKLEFVADRGGQFPIELHAADDPGGETVGILTVHER